MVQFPKGRLNFKTKKVALQWQKFFKKKYTILINRKVNGDKYGKVIK